MARKVVWGLDIGQGALKAVRAQVAEDRIEILAFDRIEYPPSAVESETDRDSAIRQALATFLGRHEVGKDLIFASTSAHNALVRFIKLPPVDRKNLPNLIRYEAHQQIPFPLDEVIWDYEALDRGFMPGEEIEVGIFAMRKEVIHRYLSNLTLVNLEVEVLQVSPLALYNFVAYEMPPETGATVVLDIGADDTDLVIVSRERVWTRTLPIAGNDLTVAVGRRFEIPFEKAEVLKKKASKSKYMREIYDAMKPALKGLIDEVQRSIGFYKGLHPETRIERLLALGNAFKLPGMGKFLMNNLQYPVVRLGGLQKFAINNAAGLDVYRENAMSFAVALGLAAQGVGKGSVRTNLLPKEIINRRIIRRKKYAAVAATAAVGGFVLMSYLNTAAALAKLGGAVVDQNAIQTLSTDISKREGDWNAARSEVPAIIGRIQAAASAGKRSEWPFILKLVNDVVPTEPNIKQQVRPGLEWRDGQRVDEPYKMFVGRNDIWVYDMEASSTGIQDSWSITLLGETRRTSADANIYLQKRLIEPLAEIPCLLDPRYPQSFAKHVYRLVNEDGVVVGEAVGTSGTLGFSEVIGGEGSPARRTPTRGERAPMLPGSGTGVGGREVRPGAQSVTPAKPKTEGRIFEVPYTRFTVEFIYDPSKKDATLAWQKEKEKAPETRPAGEAVAGEGGAQGSATVVAGAPTSGKEQASEEATGAAPGVRDAQTVPGQSAPGAADAAR
ncbi:MAG: type IV pilus assembly protein PilM [Planctomycetota bacterium]